MKNDTDTVPPGGKYMREIRRNRARDCAIGGSINSPIGDDLVENHSPGEITDGLEARRRYLQDLR